MMLAKRRLSARLSSHSWKRRWRQHRHQHQVLMRYEMGCANSFLSSRRQRGISTEMHQSFLQHAFALCGGLQAQQHQQMQQQMQNQQPPHAQRESAAQAESVAQVLVAPPPTPGIVEAGTGFATPAVADQDVETMDAETYLLGRNEDSQAEYATVDPYGQPARSRRLQTKTRVEPDAPQAARAHSDDEEQAPLGAAEWAEQALQ